MEVCTGVSSSVKISPYKCLSSYINVWFKVDPTFTVRYLPSQNLYKLHSNCDNIKGLGWLWFLLHWWCLESETKPLKLDQGKKTQMFLIWVSLRKNAGDWADLFFVWLFIISKWVLFVMNWEGLGSWFK